MGPERKPIGYILDFEDGRGILPDFNRNDSLKKLAGEYGNQMKYVSGRANEPLGKSALLVRPDGIISWPLIIVWIAAMAEKRPIAGL